MKGEPLTMDVKQLMPEALREAENQLRARLKGRASHLRLLQTHNGLVLSGRANSYYAKSLAQQAVKQLVGVPLSANDIEVA